jgi:hypothetical protein
MDETGKTSGAHDAADEVDGLLVRYLDRELSDSEEGEVRALLASSADARGRLTEIRCSSDLFSDRLWSLPIPAAPGLSMPEVSGGDRGGQAFGLTLPSLLPHHRIAAAIVLLLLTVSFLAPVRAWIVESVRTVASMLAPSEEPPVPAAEGEMGPSTVSFVPLMEELVVSMEANQASGRLTVVVVEGSRVSGEASVQEAEAEILVLPDGIEIRNGSGAMADYTIEIPRTLRRVRIRVGGREVAEESPGEVEVGHVWVFDLAGPGG